MESDNLMRLKQLVRADDREAAERLLHTAIRAQDAGAWREARVALGYAANHRPTWYGIENVALSAQADRLAVVHPHGTVSVWTLGREGVQTLLDVVAGDACFFEGQTLACMTDAGVVFWSCELRLEMLRKHAWPREGSRTFSRFFRNVLITTEGECTLWSIREDGFEHRLTFQAPEEEEAPSRVPLNASTVVMEYEYHAVIFDAEHPEGLHWGSSREEDEDFHLNFHFDGDDLRNEWWDENFDCRAGKVTLRGDHLEHERDPMFSIPKLTAPWDGLEVYVDQRRRDAVNFWSEALQDDVLSLRNDEVYYEPYLEDLRFAFSAEARCFVFGQRHPAARLIVARPSVEEPKVRWNQHTGSALFNREARIPCDHPPGLTVFAQFYQDGTGVLSDLSLHPIPPHPEIVPFPVERGEVWKAATWLDADRLLVASREDGYDPVREYLEIWSWSKRDRLARVDLDRFLGTRWDDVVPRCARLVALPSTRNLVLYGGREGWMWVLRANDDSTIELVNTGTNHFLMDWECRGSDLLAWYGDAEGYILVASSTSSYFPNEDPGREYFKIIGGDGPVLRTGNIGAPDCLIDRNITLSALLVHGDVLVVGNAAGQIAAMSMDALLNPDDPPTDSCAPPPEKLWLHQFRGRVSDLACTENGRLVICTPEDTPSARCVDVENGEVLASWTQSEGITKAHAMVDGVVLEAVHGLELWERIT